MRFVTFDQGDGSPRPGILQNEEILDLSGAGFRSILELIEQNGRGLEAARKVQEARTGALPLVKVRLLAPIPRPPRVFGIGLNYAEHATESQMQVQAVPTVFLKLSSSVIGPDADVVLPKNATQPDYEAELGVVIGRPGYRISAKDWEQYVFGYTMVNDVSARDVQLATSQWNLGKSFPTFTPLGPSIVTKDEILDPHALDISLTLDGEVMQSSNTRQLIFKLPQLIEHLSSITPLEAGDVISTGTPPGVGLGRKPQRWLRPDEEMIVRVDGLGELRNRTRAEA